MGLYGRIDRAILLACTLVVDKASLFNSENSLNGYRRWHIFTTSRCNESSYTNIPNGYHRTTIEHPD